MLLGATKVQTGLDLGRHLVNPRPPQPATGVALPIQGSQRNTDVRGHIPT